MTDVFINYRGADSNYAARLLFEGLKPRFGRQVFFDEETIQPGENYVARLLTGVRSSTVLLAVIGPQWLSAGADGSRRIDDPRDWIRRELVTAYQCGVQVIPVFTEGARPEDLDGLPADIAQLRTTQGMSLRLRNADEDIARISDEVARHVPARRRRGVVIAVALVALLLVGAGVGLSFLIRGDGGEATPDSSTPTTPSSPVVETTTAATSTTTPVTSTSPPPEEPPLWWSGNLTLDDKASQMGYTLDTSPPARQPVGDIGLMCQLSCAANEIAGTEFVAWTKAGLPTREECVDLLNHNPGQRLLSVKAGTKGCFGTAQKRVGHLEVIQISGPGRMKIYVKVWDSPPS